MKAHEPEQAGGAAVPPAMLTIKTIQEAAAKIAQFKPLKLPIDDQYFATISKLPGDNFREGLTKYTQQLAPYLEQSQQFDITALITLVLELPDFVDWLADHAIELDGNRDWSKLPPDQQLLLASAVLTVTFIDSPAVRVFINVARAVNASVAAETLAAGQETPPATKSG